MPLTLGMFRSDAIRLTHAYSPSYRLLGCVGGKDDGNEAKFPERRFCEVRFERIVLDQQNLHALKIDAKMIKKCHTPMLAWSVLPASYSLGDYAGNPAQIPVFII